MNYKTYILELSIQYPVISFDSFMVRLFHKPLSLHISEKLEQRSKKKKT